MEKGTVNTEYKGYKVIGTEDSGGSWCFKVYDRKDQTRVVAVVGTYFAAKDQIDWRESPRARR